MRHSIGWKAIIYDAPWAYFKDGQPGVIVTEDGKTCETTNDDVSSIKIVADENPFFSERTGSVLFIQNESDKQAIVDLKQAGKEHVYELYVSDTSIIEMDGCTATYSMFVNELSEHVYWLVDGERTPATIESIVKPLSSDFDNVSEGKNLQIEITSRNPYNGNIYTAEGECIISPAANPTTSYTDTVITYGDIQCCMLEVGTCNILPSNPSLDCEGGIINLSVLETGAYNIYPYNSSSDCEGGIINFRTENNAWPKYRVYLNDITAVDKFNVEDCSGGTTQITSDVSVDRISFSVIDDPSNVSDVEINGTTLTLRVKPNESFSIETTVAATTETQTKKDIKRINTSDNHNKCTN